MLPEIAAEVLQFLSRRDLDKSCGVNKWLDALIAQCCDAYPLRPVVRVELTIANDFTSVVSIGEVIRSRTKHPFDTMDEAWCYFGSILVRTSYVRILQIRSRFGDLTLLTDHWTTLIDAIRAGTVRCLTFVGVDFGALEDDAFLVAVGCRGLRSLDVHRSIVPSRFITNDLFRVSGAKGLLKLRLNARRSGAPCRLSDDAVLDFFFASDATQRRADQKLVLEGIWITDIFLTTFFRRLLSSPIRPRGCLDFDGAPKQRGMSDYAHYLAPKVQWPVVYRLSSPDDNNSYYEVAVFELPTSLYMHFGPTGRRS